MWVPLMLLAAASILLGILPNPLTNFVSQIAAAVL
jgi:hypothetical protein